MNHNMRYITYLLKSHYHPILLSILCLVSASPSPARDQEPWRLNNQLLWPDNVSLTGQHRTRLEFLDNQYRGNRNGGDQSLMFRTLIEAGYNGKRFNLLAELEDSRVALADSGSPLSATFVNPLELLQAYINIPVTNLFGHGGKGRFRAGRITMDIGSRRLVARNRFRNTINAFTGVEFQQTSKTGNSLRAFYVLPVQRQVDGDPLDNKPDFDREGDEARFWGLHYKPYRMPWHDEGEIYIFGLHEDDSPGHATRDRDLYTFGFRLYRRPAVSRFDYTLESVYQFGKSSNSTTAIEILDHFAHFQHFEIGYTFNSDTAPQLLFQFDYASGDDNAQDKYNNRFDTLFGARRFDFGPTSLYGPFARSNLISPGVRLRVEPAGQYTAFVALRGYWLASADDAWTTAGFKAPDGSDISYIGTQLEARIRWEIKPDNIRLEAGGAHLFAGSLMDYAAKNSATYLYSQLVFWF